MLIANSRVVHRRMKRIGFSVRALLAAVSIASSAFFGFPQVVSAEGEEKTAKDTDASEFAISLVWLDGTHVAYTSTAGLHFQPSQLKVLDVDSGVVTAIGQAESSLWGLTLLPEGRLVACGYEGQLLQFSDGQSKPLAKLTWSRAIVAAGGDTVVVGTQDGKLSSVDVVSGEVRKSVAAFGGAIFALHLDETTSRLTSCGGNGQVKQHSWPELEETAAINASSESAWDAALFGEHVVAVGANRQIQVLEPSTGGQLVSIASTPNWGPSLAAVPNAPLMLVGDLSGGITVVDVDCFHLVAQHVVAESGIWDLAISPDGNRLAVATRKHGVKIVDMKTLTANAAEVAEAARLLAPPVPE